MDSPLSTSFVAPSSDTLAHLPSNIASAFQATRDRGLLQFLLSLATRRWKLSGADFAPRIHRKIPAELSKRLFATRHHRDARPISASACYIPGVEP